MRMSHELFYLCERPTVPAALRIMSMRLARRPDHLVSTFDELCRHLSPFLCGFMGANPAALAARSAAIGRALHCGEVRTAAPRLGAAVRRLRLGATGECSGLGQPAIAAGAALGAGGR